MKIKTIPNLDLSGQFKDDRFYINEEAPQIKSGQYIFYLVKTEYREESGLGIVKKHKGRSWIQRIDVLGTKTNGRAKKLAKQSFREGAEIRIHSFYPNKLPIPLENTICMADGFFYLEENSFLYRENGDIKTGNKDDIIKIINSDDNLLTINNGISLSPSSRPKSPDAGTIFFNKRSRKLEFWDGSQWLEIEVGKLNEDT